MGEGGRMIELWTYEGRRPSNERLIEQLGISEDALFLTATAAQAELRRDLASPSQRSGDRSHVYFPDALRHLVGRELLTKTDLRVLIGRYGRGLKDPAASWQVRHDAGVLADALTDLWERGVEPGEGDLAYASPALAERLADLHRWLRQQPEFVQRQPFGMAARALIMDGGLPPVLVMEGFTYLTPLQRYLVTSYTTRGRLLVVIPYRAEQPRTFKALHRTYADWWPTTGPQRISTEPLPEGPLAELQQRFDFEPAAVQHSDELTITEHPHRHSEAEACLDLIQQAIEDGVSPDDIAIVTPARGQYDRLLLEQAEVMDMPVSLNIPPQLLLLTPVGRFVLLLYDLWQGDHIEVSPEQLAGLMGSGWLGGDVQRSATELRLMAAQRFRRCRTIDEWREALSALRGERHNGNPRLPTSLLASRPELVDLWEITVELVHDVTSRLFGRSPRPINEHVEALLHELDALAATERFEAEQVIVKRVREALEEATHAGGLALDDEEFGEVLVALARTYEEAAEHAGDDDAQANAAQPGRIWITTPAGIDNMERRIVIVLGLDSDAMPPTFSPGWPVVDGALDQHLNVQRYLFAAACRAASEELHLSFSHHNQRGAVGASPYLRALGFASSRPRTPPPVEDRASTPTPHRRATRDDYTLTEIAIYGLCPYRYRAELLDPAAGIVDDEFHLRLLAEADLQEAIFEAATEWDAVFTRAELRALLNQALSDLGPSVGRRYAGLGTAARRAVVDHTRRDITYITTTQLRADGYRLVIERADPRAFSVIVSDRPVTVRTSLRYHVRSGNLRYPLTGPLLRRELSFPVKRPDRREPYLIDVDGAKVFPHAGHAQRFLVSTESAFNVTGLVAGKFEPSQAAGRRLAAQIVEDIEHQQFPKNPGEHCHHCPVRDPCLGLDEQ